MRRLPVLQDATTNDAQAAARPPWQWVAIGAGFTGVIWAPLAAFAAPLGFALATRSGHPAFGSLPGLVAYALASGLAGCLVGRFGGRSARREAALGGSFAALVVCALAVLPGGAFSLIGAVAAFAALGPVGALFGALGARIGLRMRPVLG
jgi:hypothetical protein